MSLVYDLKNQSEKSTREIKKEFEQYKSSFDKIKKQESKLIDKRNELQESLKKYLDNNIEYNYIFYKEYNKIFEEILTDTNQQIKVLPQLKETLNNYNKEYKTIAPIYNDVKYDYERYKEKYSQIDKNLTENSKEINFNEHLLRNNNYQLEKYKDVLVDASVPNAKIEKYLNDENIYMEIYDKINTYHKENNLLNNFVKFFGFKKDEQYEEFKRIENKSSKSLKEYFKKLDEIITNNNKFKEIINNKESENINYNIELNEIKKQLKDLNYEEVNKEYIRLNKKIEECEKTLNIYQRLNTNKQINNFVNNIVIEKIKNNFIIPSIESEKYSQEINAYIKINNSINEMQDKLKNKMQVESSFYTQVNEQIKKIEETDRNIQKLKDKAKVNDALKSKGISKEKLKKSYDSLSDGISSRTSNNYIYTDIIDTSYMNYMLGLDFYKINMYSLLNNDSMDVNLGNLNTNEFSIFKDESNTINNTIENITDLNNSFINEITNNSLFDDSFINNIDSNAFHDIGSFDFNEISDIGNIADSISSAPSCSSGPSCSSSSSCSSCSGCGGD